MIFKYISLADCEKPSAGQKIKKIERGLLKMKKKLSVILAAAMLTAAVPCMAGAEGDTLNNFSGGTDGFTVGNIAKERVESVCAIYGRGLSDKSAKLSVTKADTAAGGINPYMMAGGIQAEEGKLLHIGLSFAAENTSIATLGLGGAVNATYKDNDGTEQVKKRTFMNGTAIETNGKTIYAFGNEIGTFEEKTWYSVDIFADTSKNTETVYLNGEKVLDDVEIASTLQATGEKWKKLDGFSDLRLNVQVGKNMENAFYFDDLRYGNVSEISVNSGLSSEEYTISGSTVDLGGKEVTNPQTILAKLSAPSGEILSSLDYASLTFDDGSAYAYKVKNNGVTVYNFNSKTGFLSSGVTYEDALGGKAAGDYAMAITDASNNFYPSIVPSADGGKVTIELNVLSKDIAAAPANQCVFGPWMNDRKNVFNMVFVEPRGVVTTNSQAGGVLGNIKSNEWHNIAATFTAGSNTAKIYFDGKFVKDEPLGADFVNITRVKLMNKDSNVFLDDVMWYSGDFDTSAHTAAVSAPIKCANTIGYTDGQTAGEFAQENARIFADGTLAAELSADEALTDSAVMVAAAPNGSTMQYYYFEKVQEGVFNHSFNGSELKSSFYTSSDSKTYMMIIAEYSENALVGLNTKTVKAGGEAPFVKDSVSYTKQAEASEIKAFIWDTATLYPYIPSYSVK